MLQNKNFSHVILSIILATSGCTSSNNTPDSASMKGVSVNGHVRIQTDSLITGANLRLLPTGQETVSTHDASFKIDSVMPGMYRLFVEKKNLLSDTSDFFEVKTESVSFEQQFKSVLGKWTVRLVFGLGDYWEGPMRVTNDQSVGIAYDLFYYDYGPWEMSENNYSMTVDGWLYSGLYRHDSLSGIASKGSSRYSWRAWRE